jgi:hypothetical protein
LKIFLEKIRLLRQGKEEEVCMEDKEKEILLRFRLLSEEDKKEVLRYAKKLMSQKCRTKYLKSFRYKALKLKC